VDAMKKVCLTKMDDQLMIAVHRLVNRVKADALIP
jgi:hypothetical protein